MRKTKTVPTLATIEWQALEGICGGEGPGSRGPGPARPIPIAVPVGRDGSGGVMLTTSFVAQNSVGGRSR